MVGEKPVDPANDRAPFPARTQHPLAHPRVVCAQEGFGYAETSAKDNSAAMFPLSFYTLALGAAALAATGYALLRRKPTTPEDVERQRRVWLNAVGRITDGLVIDVQELASEAHRAATMLIYQYDVAGVSYEASQDVTYLRQWINLQSCRLGLHTSVKYDPHNPGNSMVIAEGWMGLRQ